MHDDSLCTRLRNVAIGALVVACLAAARGSAAEPAADPSHAPPDREALERRFEEMLSGSTLVGYFTTTGEEQEEPLSPDKYTIEKVTKLNTGYWRFDARIQYQGRDQLFRMPVPVEWAGDTPVVTLTNVLVPGLGTFTARVLFYDGHYAGTWSGGDHGGHMFGQVVKTPPGDEPADQPRDEPGQ